MIVRILLVLILLTIEIRGKKRNCHNPSLGFPTDVNVSLKASSTASLHPASTLNGSGLIVDSRKSIAKLAKCGEPNIDPKTLQSFLYKEMPPFLFLTSAPKPKARSRRV